MTTFSIRYNNTSMRDACAACGDVDRREIGLYVFVGSGLDELLCDDCARRHAPELAWPLKLLGANRWSVPACPREFEVDAA